jgi:hypothetical protein
MDLPTARDITGGLSEPSKMPCKAYSTPAARCITGARLAAESPDSHCAHCYAKRGHYLFPDPRRALERRFASLRHPQWIEAMTTLIHASDHRHFRWHDSGDLQGVWHLDNIAAIARRLSSVRYWLPTREYGMVERWLASSRRPRNLIIRLSGHLFDTYPLKLARRLGVLASGAHSKGAKIPDGIFECKAHERGNHCGPCRACWDPKVFAVSYPKI